MQSIEESHVDPSTVEVTWNRPFLFDLVRSALGWFMVGAWTVLIFPAAALVAVILFPFDRSRRGIHPIISAWAKVILITCPLMRVHFEGTDLLKPDQAYVLVANHQSIADIIAVLHLKHSFKFIAKRELFWIPVFGWSLWVAGYIPLIRGDQRSGKEALAQARRYLERGVSVLLFPEGTRSPDGEIHHFKTGAFKLASEVGVPIVPVVINGTWNLIPKGRRLLGARSEVTVQIGTPERPLGDDAEKIEAFSERIRSEMAATLNEIRARHS